MLITNIGNRPAGVLTIELVYPCEGKKILFLVATIRHLWFNRLVDSNSGEFRGASGRIRFRWWRFARGVKFVDKRRIEQQQRILALAGSMVQLRGSPNNAWKRDPTSHDRGTGVNAENFRRLKYLYAFNRANGFRMDA